jgi:hypothetical protein
MRTTGVTRLLRGRMRSLRAGGGSVFEAVVESKPPLPERTRPAVILLPTRSPQAAPGLDRDVRVLQPLRRDDSFAE